MQDVFGCEEKRKIHMVSWWIDKPNILGSSNPTATELRNLFSEGFRTIISLLDEKQQPPNYDVSEIETIGYKRYSIPIKAGTAPTLPKFRKFFKIIQTSKDKILIHCQGGAGRTGTMAAAYWMKKGLSAGEAIAQQGNPHHHHKIFAPPVPCMFKYLRMK